MEGAVVEISAPAAGRPRALEARTMCEAFQITAGERPGQIALRTIFGAFAITYGDYAARVRRLAAGLHRLGVRHGETVGLMLTNRPEFHLLDTAAMHLGATPFSIYNTSSPEQIAYVVGDAGNRVMVVEAQFLERGQAALAQTGSVEHLIVLDARPAGALSLEELEAAEPASDFDFEATWRAVEPGDVLTLIYTSGTTGPPKGVQLTHANEIAECRGVDAMGQPRIGGSVVSYLPLAHIADRGLNQYGHMVWGHTITCCPDTTQLFAHVVDAKPTFFGGVPRIWEKLKAALDARIASEPDPDKQAATTAAIELALRKVRAEQAGDEVSAELRAAYAQAEERVFAPIRARIGFERCEWYMTGAAPMPLDVLEFFAAIGIPIAEVWGMSELASIATMVPRDRLKLGTVGVPIPGVEVRLAADGEVLARGGTVMAGYRNQPEKTADTFDADGWLLTGDIGAIDEDGFLKIIDRKKELIINAAGKNMSPANIEMELKAGSPLIGQTIAVGDKRPYNVALIALDPDASAVFAGERGLTDASPEALSRHPDVLAEVEAGVQRANARLARVEQIKRFKVLPCDWPPAGDELTPTMKLKRKPINEKYAAEIEALYG